MMIALSRARVTREAAVGAPLQKGVNAQVTRPDAWEAGVLLNSEHLLLWQMVNGEERFFLLFSFHEVARPARLELATLCLEGRRSIQLSYGRSLPNFSYCNHLRYSLLCLFDGHFRYIRYN
jgi:hypothetical protein